MDNVSNVAIIIPALNEERFIAACLDSVLQQTYLLDKMDIMVVDGGSTDKTTTIVEQYHRQYGNIRLLRNGRKIQSVAFNIGVDNSTAPYIVRLDAHATYNKEYIALCIDALQADSKRGNAGGRFIIQAQNDSLWAVCNQILNYSKFGIGGAAFRVGNQAGNVDTVPFGAFPRTMIDKIGGMREDLPRGEDNEYNSRIRKAGYDIYYNPEIKIYYYARPTLRSSCRQMFANGESIGHLLYIDKDAIGLRHLVPLFFVLGLLLGPLLALLWKPFLYPWLVGVFAYLLCDIVASVQATYTRGLKYTLPLCWLFLCVHVSYGIGTVKGILMHKL
ncbi:MAG: glycosyltransferase family 2 protein [Paludibacteraceae bacterium]